jgi:beta-aspartyl-peptidase (threonine type)
MSEAIGVNHKVRIIDVAPSKSGYSLVLHGGAGNRLSELSLDQQGQYAAGLAEAYEAGEAVLARGGVALDAVCAAVEQLENNPLFNAGRGAALTKSGIAELDASVMTGDGRAGAIAASRYAKNPVYLARKVMEDHVLLVAPNKDLVEAWGLEISEPDYFVTPMRQGELEKVQSNLIEGSRHGTVGAVALDKYGHLAAATSTGGMTNQSEGRVGDTPIIGSGNYAKDGVVAVSCTGHGEAFMQGVVAHEISSKMRYTETALSEAVASTIEAEVGGRGVDGGIIAIDAEGRIVVAHNSSAMFAAYREDLKLITLT